MNKLCLTTALIVGMATGQARATDIGQIAVHGSDLRNMCLKNEFDVDTHTICYAMIDKLINENVENQGRAEKYWNIPDGVQIEDLEQDVMNYMKTEYVELDRSDAHILVGIVLACAYPSDATKEKMAAHPPFSKECATIHSGMTP